jgi:lysophospholipase L1-like esterase
MTAAYGPAAQPLVFDSQHAAVWGKPAITAKDNIAELVQMYQPDLVLVALGFNDMGWFYSDDVGTLASMKTYIQNAQAVNPYVQFVVANVPYRTYIGGRDDLITKTQNYDTALTGMLVGLETASSQIGIADFNSQYGCDPHANTCDSTYDGLHPNYKGEFRIAQAFANALNAKFGRGPRLP